MGVVPLGLMSFNFCLVSYIAVFRMLLFAFVLSGFMGLLFADQAQKPQQLAGC